MLKASKRVKRRIHFEITRRRISNQFIRGDGIEIGALHKSLWTSRSARVLNVDRMSADDLRSHYPELAKYRLAHVDVVDDGERLSKIGDCSLDFVIANHFIEHCENPLATMRNHLRVLRSGGVLYYAVPDKTQTFDRHRHVTSFEHLLRDDREGPERSREQHYREWVELVIGEADRDKALNEIARLSQISYSIHFHVWDSAAFSEFVVRSIDYTGNVCSLIHLEQNVQEFIVVLRKA